MAGPSKPSIQGGAIIAKTYHLLGKIGEGSFGVIFFGENVENREQVAIKIEAKESVHPQTLLEEARLLKALHSISEEGIVVYLIDFGLAKRFRDQRGKHFRFRQMENREITGTTRYASIDAHKGMELSRRDDLESLGYVLLYFCKGSLPWQGLQSRNDQERYKLITDGKLSISVESLCHELPDELRDYLNYCRGLKYEEEPNYEFIKGLFKRLASKIEIKYDRVFDWS